MIPAKGWKTVDGKFYSDEKQAIKHETYIFNLYKKTMLGNLESQQRSDKRILSFPHNENTPRIQWEVSIRKKLIAQWAKRIQMSQ